MTNAKELLDKLSEILNKFEEDNNVVIILDIEITAQDGTIAFTYGNGIVNDTSASYMFDGAHFTRVEPDV